jgi:hypothetical protein
MKNLGRRTQENIRMKFNIIIKEKERNLDINYSVLEIVFEKLLSTDTWVDALGTVILVSLCLHKAFNLAGKSDSDFTTELKMFH